MLALAILLAQSAVAQTFGAPTGPLLDASDLNWPGYINTTMGSPAVAQDNFELDLGFFTLDIQITLVFYETQVGPPTAGCPAGEWGVGLATKVNGFPWRDRGPIVEPGDVPYATCVAAHPSVVRIADDPATWVLFFKAEQDTVACPTCDRYPGVGRLVFQRSTALANNVNIAGFTVYTHTAPDANPVMASVAAEMGYPSVVFADGEYHMAFTQEDDVYVASSSNTVNFVAPATPAFTAGSTTWDGEQLFSPSLVCQGPSDFELFVGGRTFDAYPGVIDQAMGMYTTTDLATYTEDAGSPFFSVGGGDDQMRHFDMTTASGGTEYGVFYTTPGTSGNELWLSRTSGWDQANIDPKRCP